MPSTRLCGRDIATGDPVYTCLNSTVESVLAAGTAYTLTATVESVLAAGTAYTLTATAAALDFGTTDPTITLDATGNYLLSFWVVEQFNGATFATSRTITYKLRKTSGTAADVTNGAIAHATGVVTTLTTPGYQYSLYQVPYAGTEGDVITIFGSVSVLPTAGDVTVSGARITAELLS